MHIWALGLSWETQGLAQQPENSKRAHFRAPALQTPPKFHARTPRERKKKENCGGRREKKERNFGPPTLLGSTLLGSTPLGSTLRGPTFSRFGASTFWAPPFWAPPFWAPPFGAPLFPVLGLHLLGPTSTPHFVVPKFNIQKLAEVEIGRSRSPLPRSVGCKLETSAASFGHVPHSWK